MRVPVKRTQAKSTSLGDDQLDAFPGPSDDENYVQSESTSALSETATDSIVIDTVSSTELERAQENSDKTIRGISSAASDPLTLFSQIVDTIQSGELNDDACATIAKLVCEAQGRRFNLDGVMISLAGAEPSGLPVTGDHYNDEGVGELLRRGVESCAEQASLVHFDVQKNSGDSKHATGPGLQCYVVALPIYSGNNIVGGVSGCGDGDLDQCIDWLKIVCAMIELWFRDDVTQSRLSSLLNEAIVTHHDLSAFEVAQSQTGVAPVSDFDDTDPSTLLALYLDSPVIVLAVDRAGVIQHASRYALESLRYHHHDLVGKNISMLFASTSDKAISERLAFCLAEPDQISRHECGVRRGDGSWLQIREVTRFIGAGDGMFSVVLQDVTDTYRRSRELEYRATHDGLTGLVNRVEFERRLCEAIRAVSLDGASHTLCYLDLDHFKGINDSSGHNAGDEILKQMARVFVGQIRQSDTIARLGGDEFAVLMEFCTLENARRLAEDLRRAVEEFEFEWQGRSFPVSVSIGMTTIESADDIVADVMARADGACYNAKSAGRNQISIGSATDADQKDSPELTRVKAIEQALDSGSFEIEMQSALPVSALAQEQAMPILNQLSLRLWLDGARLTADEFMPAAEHAGLGNRVDEWMLDQLLNHLKQRENQLGDIYLLNLSAATIYNPNFLLKLKRWFADDAVDPASLCFACSETLLATARVAVEKFSHEIQKSGCSFCISELGSGFASFELIRDTNANYCCVAPSVVEKIGYSAVDLSILTAITKICAAAGIRTVVGSLNTDQQYELATGLGIDYLQGDCVDQPRVFEPGQALS